MLPYLPFTRRTSPFQHAVASSALDTPPSPRGQLADEPRQFAQRPRRAGRLRPWWLAPFSGAGQQSTEQALVRYRLAYPLWLTRLVGRRAH